MIANAASTNNGPVEEIWVKLHIDLRKNGVLCITKLGL